ncbi:helix-turn-helix domain-containing protein [Streptomyces sp. NPDC005900]|uniref:helix-turn-helix domain-containing protein n=1 Tax=Streptomyces sp. NPDC005900 TaxID=3154569 RepID=UPI003402AE5C
MTSGPLARCPLCGLPFRPSSRRAPQQVPAFRCTCAPSTGLAPEAPSPQARYQEHILDIAEDILRQAADLHEDAFNDGDTADLLSYKHVLQRLLEDFDAAVVGRGRVLGEPSKDLAEHLHLSPETLRKKLTPEKIDRRLADRVRPVPAPRAPRSGRQTEEERIATRSNRRRLAAALSYMQRASGRPQYRLAQDLNTSASYISRMMSGERPASWLHVRQLAASCGYDPELLRPLCNAAQGGPVPRDIDALAYLKCFLKALRMSVGQPSEETLMAHTSHCLTREAIAAAFDGPDLPSWATTRRLAAALCCPEKDIRPLWRAAKSAVTPRTGTPSEDDTRITTMPADAMG